MEGCKTIFCS